MQTAAGGAGRRQQKGKPARVDQKIAFSIFLFFCRIATSLILIHPIHFNNYCLCFMIIGGDAGTEFNGTVFRRFALNGFLICSASLISDRSLSLLQTYILDFSYILAVNKISKTAVL